MKQIEVVAAIIRFKDLILCVQRRKSALAYVSEKFEFPGGKIELGETKTEALKRELIEELNIEPRISDLYLTVTHQYPDFLLTMHSYYCDTSSQEINLTEHISHRWLKRKDLLSLDWAAADIPIVQKLMKE
jgi:8-oxo-dGTP diphosphatase